MARQTAQGKRQLHTTHTGAQATPRWGQLYLLLPLLVGLLLVERRQPLSRSGHMAVQFMIVLLIYGLLAWWLQVNRAPLRSTQPKAARYTVYVVHVRPADLPINSPRLPGPSDTTLGPRLPVASPRLLSAADTSPAQVQFLANKS